jgi:hypothetical protein
LAAANLGNYSVNPVNPIFKAVNATNVIYCVNGTVIAITNHDKIRAVEVGIIHLVNGFPLFR